MKPLFFDGWLPLLRTGLQGVMAYVLLVLLLRFAGKRTLAKMNAFDLVVSVSLGSALATIVLSADLPLLRGALALGLLVAMQLVITWTSVRVSWFRRFVTGEPSLLVYRGATIPSALRRARVTEAELHAALRSAGHAGPSQVGAVVLETDGSFSIVGTDAGDGPSLGELRREHLEPAPEH